MSAHLHLAVVALEADCSRRAEFPIQVVVVDDHAAMRRSLRLLLDNEENVEVIAEAADVSTVTRHVHDHVPHLVVLDRKAPAASGIETTGRIRSQVSGPPVKAYCGGVPRRHQS
jgi:DNA-binding NarL/FixJ family response regulator